VILVDTSIWVDHLRQRDEILDGLLSDQEVLIHPFVIGELAMGNFRQREAILDDLRELPLATVAMDHELLDFVQTGALFGVGIGFVDAHLLASARLTPEARLWTRDKRLDAAARRMSLAARVGN
jgi:predicted nucleic acid-binding protein